jgi:hypothetical protein
VAECASGLQASQVPLVYWAFASLGYCPVAPVLAALDDQVRRKSTQLSAQVRLFLRHLLKLGALRRNCLGAIVRDECYCRMVAWPGNEAPLVSAAGQQQKKDNEGKLITGAWLHRGWPWCSRPPLR